MSLGIDIYIQAAVIFLFVVAICVFIYLNRNNDNPVQHPVSQDDVKRSTVRVITWVLVSQGFLLGLFVIGMLVKNNQILLVVLMLMTVTIYSLTSNLYYKINGLEVNYSYNSFSLNHVRSIRKFFIIFPLLLLSIFGFVLVKLFIADSAVASERITTFFLVFWIMYAIITTVALLSFKRPSPNNQKVPLLILGLTYLFWFCVIWISFKYNPLIIRSILSSSVTR